MIWKYLICTLWFVQQLTNGEPINEDDLYKIGFGIGDITGPAGGINMMGYAKLGQDTAGIHTRLYSRAFIVEKDSTRIAYVNVDLCGSGQLVKLFVLEKLEQLFGKGVYTHENVLISATHTHSGPGGYFQYLVYIITQEGFIKDAFDSVVNGIVKSIKDAHNSLTPGHIYYSEGQLFNASVNRSPASYSLNPPEERIGFESDTDKTFQVLKFTNTKGEPIGMSSWFAVHGVSMNLSNKLISSDNKGYASLLFEQDFNGYSSVGKGPFVAIFGQANEGDASPNTQGARCLDTGKPCDYISSTCDGKTEYCVAFGPGKDMFESTKIIGRRQYDKAKELFANAKEKISGGLHYIYQNIHMSKQTVQLENGYSVKTCPAALGHSFAAGTTDGEGPDLFRQGTTHGHESKFWNMIRDFIKIPSKEMVECQLPKAVLLAVGEIHFPVDWTPEIMPTQMFELGNLVFVALPGEFTTMSGRRIRNDIEKIYADNGRKVHVILAGLSNTYSNYVTTFEEYQLQRYEGGSTLFGPYTLEAYRQQFRYLAKNLLKREKIDTGPEIPNLYKKEITLKPHVLFDEPYRKHFGDVIMEPKEKYVTGERVEVQFSAAHPRNNLRLEDTFLVVEKYEKDDKWITVATDAHWETMFIWERESILLGTSKVTIIWDIPMSTQPGIYRIRYFGDAKHLNGAIEPFVGITRQFTVSKMPLFHFWKLSK